MKQLILIVILALSINTYAQDEKTVTLVVSGQGKTQDQAKQNALRSAIEQAFGTFISSKTEILNDNLVKDEIVSVANGNIQNFEVISEVQTPNGEYSTSLKATVSVTKLTSFVESKGVVVEFKGSILAANVKQQMLNEQNEIKSIGNIVGTCKEILDLSCDFDILRGEPKQQNNNYNWAVPITINVKFNKNIEQFNQYLFNSIKGLCMSPEEVLQYKKLEKKTFKIALGGYYDGKTNNIEDLESIAKSHPEFSFKLVRGDFVITESDDVKSIKHAFEKRRKMYLKKYGKEYPMEIKYYDKKVKPIYHFRTKTTVMAIIDLIYYTKHSVLNFEINNGINIISPEKLFADDEKRWTLKLIEDNLTPIFNSRHNFSNFKLTSNGPSGLIGSCYKAGSRCYSNSRTVPFKYEPVFGDIDQFYYNGGRGRFDQENERKYRFLLQADNDLPDGIKGLNFEETNGYHAVISLFDYTTYGTNVVIFYYEDILSLTDLEKVQEYKINAVSKK